MNSRLMLPQAALLSSPAAESALDVIFIDGFVGQTVIGIDDDELHRTQPVRIDLQAGVPRVRACSTDRIQDTIDYSEVRTHLIRLLAGHQAQLLEALAEQIASLLLQQFHARWVRVAVAKPGKFPDVQAVGIVIERRAEEVRAAARKGSSLASLIGEGMVPQAV